MSAPTNRTGRSAARLWGAERAVTRARFSSVLHRPPCKIDASVTGRSASVTAASKGNVYASACSHSTASNSPRRASHRTTRSRNW